MWPSYLLLRHCLVTRGPREWDHWDEPAHSSTSSHFGDERTQLYQFTSESSIIKATVVSSFEKFGSRGFWGVFTFVSLSDLTVMGQMTQTNSWGSEVEFIYACGPRGGSLQILGAGARQKPAYIGRG